MCMDRTSSSKIRSKGCKSFEKSSAEVISLLIFNQYRRFQMNSIILCCLNEESLLLSNFVMWCQSFDGCSLRWTVSFCVRIGFNTSKMLRGTKSWLPREEKPLNKQRPPAARRFGGTKIWPETDNEASPTQKTETACGKPKKHLVWQQKLWRATRGQKSCLVRPADS